MSRSRAFTRANRFASKRKRRNLRSCVPRLQVNPSHSDEVIDHSNELLDKSTLRDALLELTE